VGIFERIEDLAKSYFNNGEGSFSRSAGERRFADPDINAAYEELDEFLKTGKSGTGNFSTGKSRAAETGPSGGRNAGYVVPEELRGDFAELGVPFGASADECKSAYKQLLKKHHPDRHAGHQGNMRKATEKSARLNAAFDRIERWRTTGRSC
jgi:hypothetical protein